MVKEATVGEGPTMKRIKSRARGSASTIRKRTSHIRIVLSDEIVIPQRKPKTDRLGQAQEAAASRRREERSGKGFEASAPQAAIETSTPAKPASAGG